MSIEDDATPTNPQEAGYRALRLFWWPNPKLKPWKALSNDERRGYENFTIAALHFDRDGTDDSGIVCETSCSDTPAGSFDRPGDQRPGSAD